MSKTDQSTQPFDPEGVGVRNGNYFGMPFVPEEAALVLISVPWDVTSSYGEGSSAAPDAIIEASTQLDFYDPWALEEWRKGIATLPVDYSIAEKNAALRDDARKIIECQEAGGRIEGHPLLTRKLEKINSASAELNEAVYKTALEWLRHGKIVGLVGGDHSVPLGLIRAIAEHYGAGKDGKGAGGDIGGLGGGRMDGNGTGILHLDAHCDLREKYEGFDHSHASIMFNALGFGGIDRIVQVGVRDFSRTELQTASRAQTDAGEAKVVQFTGQRIAEDGFAGVTWAEQCERIVAELPERVYISFDIDVLSPEFCRNTGTPVPGGLSFDRATWLIKKVVDSGRTIVGFDLCEVAPSPADVYDASVGARVLFKLCGQALRNVP